MPTIIDPKLFKKYRPIQIDGLPKYAQLRETLRAAINDGHWPPGTRLPTEADLARDTPFSLGTVQKALKDLVTEGIVLRHQGHGTFVADRPHQMDAPWHCRFLGNSEGGFLPVFPRAVLRRPFADAGPWTDIFDLDGTGVLQIDRVIRIGESFEVYSRYFTDRRRFSGLLDKTDGELESTNFKVLLRREHNIRISYVNQTLRVATFPAFVNKALSRKTGTIGCVLEIVAGAGRKNPIYYQEIYIPPDGPRLYISDSTFSPPLSGPSSE